MNVKTTTNFLRKTLLTVKAYFSVSPLFIFHMYAIKFILQNACKFLQKCLALEKYISPKL